jgi:hypothetical protein
MGRDITLKSAFDRLDIGGVVSAFIIICSAHVDANKHCGHQKQGSKARSSLEYP